jgi:hypothetical protein
MMRTFLGAAAVAATVLFGGAASAATVFDDGATDFNGQYRGVGFLDVTFSAAAGDSPISFDLFGANSVDGDNEWRDDFEVSLNGTPVFRGSFSMSGGGANVVDLNTLGWVWSTVTNPGGNFEGGVTSVSGLVTLLAGSNTLRVTFSSPGPNNNGDQGLGDESWALNDLQVAAIPLPATLSLLALGLGGLALAGRRRLG